jgi:phage tail protein X
MEAVIDNFHATTLDKTWRANPFRAYVDQEIFDPQAYGANPKILTYTHTLPTGYPVNLADITLSTGLGSAACNTPAERIERGQIERTIIMRQKAFDTADFCAADYARIHDAEGAIAAFEAGIAETVTVFFSDFYRLMNIAMVSNKVATTTNGIAIVQGDTNADFTGLPVLPDEEASWAHLEQVHDILRRSGIANELAIGVSDDGGPVFPLVLSAGYYRKLFKDDTQVRSAITYTKGYELLSNLGVKMSVNGFAAMIDEFPIRFGLTAGGVINAVNQLTLTNAIYPTEIIDAVANPSLVTAGKDTRTKLAYSSMYDVPATGKAQFEVMTVLPKGVYKMLFETQQKARVGKQTFDAREYSGDIKFINNKTYRGENDHGNIGYYHVDVRLGAMPLRPDWGVSILTLAKGI